MARRRKRIVADAREVAVWWTVGGPCAVVFAMLFLGTVLRAPANGAQTGETELERHGQPVDLAAIAAEDAASLSASGGAWTLQFLMACKRENLEPLVDALQNQPNFFLLGYPENGKDCYRVCWGRFHSKAEAERPRVYPDALRDLGTRWARPIEDVLP